MGPLVTTEWLAGELGRPGLVVFDAEDVGEVERFSAQDPYVLNGVYGRIEILRWDKTIG